MKSPFRRAAAPLIVAAALVAIAAFPNAAGAFGVSAFTYSNSTLQAAGHPNVTISFQRTGSENEDVRDVILDLPPGVFPNAEAANPKCTATQFGNDQCPGSSQVGSISTSVTVAGVLPLTINGTV